MSDHDRAMAHLRRFGLKEPGDPFIANVRSEVEAAELPISPPVGEMSGRTEGGAVPPASPRVHRLAFEALSLPVRVSLADSCQILDRLGRQVAVVDVNGEMPDNTTAAIAAMVVAAVNAFAAEPGEEWPGKSDTVDGGGCDL